jgi:hypothetical protein
MANTNLLPSSGDLNLSLNNPRASAPYGALTLTGMPPFVVLNAGNQIRLTPEVGALVTTELTPTGRIATLTTAGVGTLTLLGNAPGSILRPAAGSLTLTGVAGGRGQGIVPTRGALTLTLGRFVEPEMGFVSLTGATPGVQFSITAPIVQPIPGAVAITGSPVFLTGSGGGFNTTLQPLGGELFFGEGVWTPPTGALTVTGVASSLRANTIRPPNEAALSLIGVTLSTLINTLKLPPVAALTLTGQAARVPGPILTPPPALLLFLNAYTPTVLQSLTPAAGSLTITGQFGGILGQSQASPSPGALALTGFGPSLEETAILSTQLGTGGLSLTGAVPLVGFLTGIMPTTGALQLLGASSSIPGLELTPPSATLALEGSAPSTDIGGSMSSGPGRGTLTLAGQAPVVLTFRLTRGYRFVARPRRGAIVVPERTE